MARATGIKKDIRELETVSGRAGSDTIRLWEGYRDQAYMWRAVALLQMPATALAIAAALIMYFFADTIIEVPDYPTPGFYSAKRLPDAQFIEAAEEFVNLFATYTPATVRKQYSLAQKMLWEPALSEFQESIMTRELPMAEQTNRSQVFFIEEDLIKIERFPNEDKVTVRLPGTRQKLLGGQAVAPEQFIYYITMTTVPRNSENPYGIVIVDVRNQAMKFKEVQTMDQEAVKAERRKARRSKKQIRTSDVQVPPSGQ